MPKSLTILLIGVLAVVVMSAAVAVAIPALWFSVTAPIRAERGTGQPTEVAVPQPPNITNPAASPVATLSPAPATTSMPTELVSDDGCTPAGTLMAENGQMAYQGISFHLDPRLATTVTVEHCRAMPLGVAPLGSHHPAGLTFTFLSHLRRVYFQPQVAIYAVEGDMQGYPYPVNSLGELKTLLNERPEPSPWLDDTTLHVRPQYLDFTGGAGVRLITQDQRDIFFYTNNNVFYNFDGLTSDGRFYVSVRVPVALPFLMDLDVGGPRTNHNPQAIPIPDWPQYGYQQRPIIDAYNREALPRIEQAIDADFTPDLALLDALARSLAIEAP